MGNKRKGNKKSKASKDDIVKDHSSNGSKVSPKKMSPPPSRKSEGMSGTTKGLIIISLFMLGGAIYVANFVDVHEVIATVRETTQIYLDNKLPPENKDDDKSSNKAAVTPGTIDLDKPTEEPVTEDPKPTPIPFEEDQAANREQDIAEEPKVIVEEVKEVENEREKRDTYDNMNENEESIDKKTEETVEITESEIEEDVQDKTEAIKEFQQDIEEKVHDMQPDEDDAKIDRQIIIEWTKVDGEQKTEEDLQIMELERVEEPETVEEPQKEIEPQEEDTYIEEEALVQEVPEVIDEEEQMVDVQDSPPSEEKEDARETKDVVIETERQQDENQDSQEKGENNQELNMAPPVAEAEERGEEITEEADETEVDEQQEVVDEASKPAEEKVQATSTKETEIIEEKQVKTDSTNTDEDSEGAKMAEEIDNGAIPQELIDLLGEDIMEEDDDELLAEMLAAEKEEREWQEKKKREEEEELERRRKAPYPKADITSKEDNKIRHLLDEVEDLLEKKDTSTALREVNHVLNKYPHSPRAIYARARAYDDLAEQERSNTFLERAVNEYLHVLDAPGVPKVLGLQAGRKCAQRQTFRGWSAQAAKTIRRLIELYPEEDVLWNELGVKYLMSGKNEDARHAFKELLRRKPDDGFAKVHIGFIIKTIDNDFEEGITYLQQGIATQEPGVIDGRFYFHLGDALYRTGKHREAYDVYSDGADQGLFKSMWQRSLYNVDRLTSRPWWDKEQTKHRDFLDMYEDNWETIRDEGLAQMDPKTGSFIPEDENLRETGDWKQFTLFAQGRKNEKNCAKAPKTCALIEKFYDAATCKRGQVKYSVMHPGVHVWPHCGPTNCRIRAHLGLVVPPGPRIRVVNETRTWKEGEFIIFDDSFEHEVWHDGDSFRLVLIMDIWHPELTVNEKRSLSPI